MSTTKRRYSDNNLKECLWGSMSNLYELRLQVKILINEKMKAIAEAAKLQAKISEIEVIIAEQEFKLDKKSDEEKDKSGRPSKKPKIVEDSKENGCKDPKDGHIAILITDTPAKPQLQPIVEAHLQPNTSKAECQITERETKSDKQTDKGKRKSGSASTKSNNVGDPKDKHPETPKRKSNENESLKRKEKSLFTSNKYMKHLNSARTSNTTSTKSQKSNCVQSKVVDSSHTKYHNPTNKPYKESGKNQPINEKEKLISKSKTPERQTDRKITEVANKGQQGNASHERPQLICQVPVTLLQKTVLNKNGKETVATSTAKNDTDRVSQFTLKQREINNALFKEIMDSKRNNRDVNDQSSISSGSLVIISDYDPYAHSYKKMYA